MTVLCEESVVLDRVAETTDLLSKVVTLLIHLVERLGDCTIFAGVMVELDWTWIDVAVIDLPLVSTGFESLER